MMPHRATRIIPVSPLRSFYQRLRGMNTAEVRDLIHTSANPQFIDELFRSSLEHLASYQNPEPFHNDRRPGWERFRDTPRKFAKCIVANLEGSGARGEWLGIEDAAGTEYRVVDYEIGPLRTRRAQFEDGQPGRSSGQGGIDLLLATRDRVPVIGEIKAPNDANMFVAFVQALTYAAELLTHAQQERLATAYPWAFSPRPPDPRCEILLIIGGTDRHRLMDETLPIARALMDDREATVARHVRRIVLAEATVAPSAPPRFHLLELLG